MSEKIHILIIEDVPTDAELCEREVRKSLPHSEFMCVDTEKDYLAALKSFQPGLIISDYAMPQFDGMTALKLALKLVPETPFIILTGSMNEETAVECMKAGAWDYVIKEHIKRLGSAVISVLHQAQLRKKRQATERELLKSEELFRKLFEEHSAVKLIVDPDTGWIINANDAAANFYGWSRERLRTMKVQDINTLPPEKVEGEMKKALASKRVRFEFRHRLADNSIRDVEVFSSKIETKGKKYLHSVIHDITDRKRAEARLHKLIQKLRDALGASIHVMLSAVEIRDPYTAGHQRRVADLARAIATELEFSEDRCNIVRIAGVVHDVGKLYIPAEILTKPGKLSDNEFALIKEHPLKGHEILKDVLTDWPLAEIVYQHHERMDGSGYPRQLRGGQILKESCIIGIADVVEAMASHRPYRPGLGIEAALEEIQKNKGSLYDTEAAYACLRLFKEKGYELPDKSDPMPHIKYP